MKLSSINSSQKKSYRIRRKLRFTLIEVMVSLALMALLFTALFSAYSSVTYAGRKIEHVRDRAFSMRYLQSRLSSLFSNVSLSNKRTQHFFLLGEESSYVKGESLVFTFDNGFSCDPAFAGLVLARLYLTPAGDLSLLIWPLEGERKSRKELLLPNVETLRFVFLTEEGEEVETWDQELQSLPIATSLTLTVEGKELAFAFAHPKGMKPISVESL